MEPAGALVEISGKIPECLRSQPNERRSGDGTSTGPGAVTAVSSVGWKLLPRVGSSLRGEIKCARKEKGAEEGRKKRKDQEVRVCAVPAVFSSADRRILAPSRAGTSPSRLYDLALIVIGVGLHEGRSSFFSTTTDATKTEARGKRSYDAARAAPHGVEVLRGALARGTVLAACSRGFGPGPRLDEDSGARTTTTTCPEAAAAATPPAAPPETAPPPHQTRGITPPPAPLATRPHRYSAVELRGTSSLAMF
ncbi:hypothetical protein HPB50_004833 [Hyalomma asiaticum]|uniref:Uncharacterized protein n=1 Tax=Hyalomma asiaticum TaxID=266040 RepID=A0ACB7SMV8_HYAAI|nr:hypothetical protein HPB50_004833 [Hyalomma asiaticum]